MTGLRVAGLNAHDHKAAVAAAMQRCDLLLANEAPAAKRPGWSVHRGGKDVLTAWRAGLWADAPVSRWHQAHGGIAGVTPRRGSLVTDGTLASGDRLRVINGHRINGTGWPGVRRRPFWRWRRQRWHEHDRLDRRLIADLVDEGYTVLHGSDVNRKDMPKPHPDAIPLRANGITQLWLIPGARGPQLRVGKTGAVEGIARGSSHRLQWADLHPTTHPAPPPPVEEHPMPTPTQRVVRNLRARGLEVLDHDDWDAQHKAVYAERRRIKPTRRPADTLVQHITVTLDTGPLTGDFARDVRTVERIGYDRFGSGVSYNWVVDMATGMIAVGQPLDAKGTHTVNDKNVPGFSRDQNYAARAIAVLGMENAPLSKNAEHAIAQLIAAMIDEGELTETFDYAPHSMFTWKGCPCDATRDRMPAIRAAAVGRFRTLGQQLLATVVVANVASQAKRHLHLEDGPVTVRGGVKVIQRNLNRKYDAGLRVTGVWDTATDQAWRHHERRVGVSGRPGVPDRSTVLALSGAVFLVK